MVAFLLPVFLCLVGPWWQVYQFNHDEGMNLTTAALITEGYSLYGEIWSDQAPLVSYILAVIHELSGGSVALARAGILAFGAIAASSLFCLVRSYHGRFAAWISIILLATSQIFAKNSVSAMIGIPALAFALLGMAVLYRESKSRQGLFLCLSGILFGLSLQSKLFTLLLAPVLVLLVYESRMRCRSFRDLRKVAVDILVVTGCAAATFIVIAWLNGVLSLEKIFGVHAAARSSDALSGRGGFRSLLDQMWRSETPIVIFGVIGILMCLARLERRNLVVLFWVLVAVAGLSMHRPLWKHHLVLLIVPLCWVAGAGISQGLNHVISGKIAALRNPGLVYVLVTAVVLAGVSPSTVYIHQRFTQGHDIPETFHRLAWFHADDTWMVTDAPLDAYRLATPVPPELALYSEKRVKTGNLDFENLRGLVERYQPTQVSLRRKITPVEFREWMMSHSRTTQSYSLRSTLLHSGRYFHWLSPTGQDDILEGFELPRGPAKEEAINAVLGLLATTFDMAYIVFTYGYGGIFYHRYGHRYDGFNEGTLLSSAQVVARIPQSTQQMGQCFLDAYKATGRPQLLGAAMRSARALACVQDRDGNWETSAGMPPGCLDADDQVDRISGYSGEIVDADSHGFVLVFARNLATALENSPHGPPRWLLEMVDAGERASTSANLPATGQAANKVDPASDAPDYNFQRELIMASNPDGLQTTEDLVNQCYSMIRALPPR